MTLASRAATRKDAVRVVETEAVGVYNIVDDDPARLSDRLPNEVDH